MPRNNVLNTKNRNTERNKSELSLFLFSCRRTQYHQSKMSVGFRNILGNVQRTLILISDILLGCVFQCLSTVVTTAASAPSVTLRDKRAVRLRRSAGGAGRQKCRRLGRTCNQRKVGKPQILCFGFPLIAPFHCFSRAFEGA